MDSQAGLKDTYVEWLKYTHGHTVHVLVSDCKIIVMKCLISRCKGTIRGKGLKGRFWPKQLNSFEKSHTYMYVRMTRHVDQPKHLF